MKQLFKHSLLILALLLPTLAMAHDFEVDGIYYNIAGTNAIVTYRGQFPGHAYTGSVIIPTTVTYAGRTFSVTAIDSNTFSSCDELTSVTIPNSVTTIGYRVFSDCSSLTSITVESGNPKYDSRNNCNALIETASNTLIAGCMNTTIPNSVTTISDYAFASCSGLTSVTIPNSVTTIGDEAFNGCIWLNSVTIGNSVTTISREAFKSCSSLTSVIIPNSVTLIGSQAFYNCRGLTSVTCLAVTPPIATGYDIFYGVTSQATLYVPRGSVAAYQAADTWKKFSQIVGIFAIDIFEVEDMWYQALDESTAMVIQMPDEECYRGDVVIPETVTYQDVTFSVTTIDEGAFEDCYDLNSLVIGDAVEVIGENAFQGCTGLTSVTIGSGVTNIGAKAFNYCNALQTVTCRGMVPPVMASSNCFTNAAYSKAVLKVPRPEIETYASADYWYKFNNIQGWGYLDPGDVNGDGEVNIADVNAVIDIILGGNSSTTAADVNGDGEINIADINAVIDIILEN